MHLNAKSDILKFIPFLAFQMETPKVPLARVTYTCDTCLKELRPLFYEPTSVKNTQEVGSKGRVEKNLWFRKGQLEITGEAFGTSKHVQGSLDFHSKLFVYFADDFH